MINLKLIDPLKSITFATHRSGGYQYFTGVRGGCNMQRVLSFKDLSKHLLYHMSNNKQKQLLSDRMLRADHLFAQMNSVLKKAQAAMNSIVEHNK
jgi:hypothetical protein